MKIELSQRYEGMPKNLAFILTDKFKAVFTGGFGNGKTESLCWRGILLALKFPKALGLIGRATYPELRDSTIRSFFDVCPPDLIKDFHRQDNKVTFINGAEVLFRAFDDPRKVLSMNLGWFGIDQIEEVSEEMYLQLLGRLRSQDCRFAFGVGNPETNWTKKRFKDTKGQDKDLLFIEATTMENPHLPSDYVENLKKNYPDFWVKRYVYGDWNTFEGMVFTEYTEAKHVIDPFEVPKAWKREFVIDYGYRNPLACIVIAIDYDDNYYIINEHYEREKVISEHAEKIKALGYTKDQTIWIDPSCGAKNRTKNNIQVSIIDEFIDEGINPIPANNEIAGVMRVNQWFKEGRLKIFRNCLNTVREVSELRWKKVKPDWDKNIPEEIQDKDDHCFVEGTLVTMADSSQKRIEAVAEGDSVITREGIRKVTRSRITKKNAEIWRLYLSNGKTIDATPSHNIITPSGKRTLDSLKYKDVLYGVCENKLYSEIKNIHGMVDISHQLVDARMGVNAFTLQSGRVLMGLFLPDITSIIKIMTERIMRLRTLNAWIRSNISSCIHCIFQKKLKNGEEPNCSKSIILPQNGTDQKQGESGIGSMELKAGSTRPALKRFVNSVVENMKHIKLSIQSIVIPIVTKLLNDQSVWVIGVRPLNIKSPVFNLTIDTAHEYYANGILVANCPDCIKYFANSRPSSTPQPKDLQYFMKDQRDKLLKVGKHKRMGNWYDGD